MNRLVVPLAAAVLSGPLSSIARLLVPLFLAFVAATISAATVRTWSGAALTTGNWTSAANWSGGAPVAGDVLLFPDTGGRRTSNTNNFVAGTIFSALTFGDSGYRLRGNRVTLSNSVNAALGSGTNTVDLDISAGQFALLLRSFSSADALVLNGDLNLNNRTLTTEGPGDFTIGGVISGSGGILKNNTGDLRLSGLGANTFTGTTVVNAGLLRLNRFNIFGEFIFVGTTAIPGDLVIGTGTGGLIGDVVVLDRDNQIANTSDVTVNGTGSLELSDENDTIGSLTLTAGFVTTGTGTLTLGGPVTVNAGTKDAVIAGRLNLGAGTARLFNVLQGGELTITARVDGDAGISLVKSNRGELFLAASNIFDGPVEIVGGTLIVGHGAALGTATGDTVLKLGSLDLEDLGVFSETLDVQGPSATLRLVGAGSAAWNGSVLLNDDLNIRVPTNRFLTITGKISGPAGFTKLDDGILQFKTTYTNTYAGTGWVREGGMILDGVFHQPVITGPLIIGYTNDPPRSHVVSLIKANQIGDTVPVTLNRSGLLRLGGLNDTVGPLTFNGGAIETGAGLLTLNGDVLAYATNQTAFIEGQLALGGATRTFYTLGLGAIPDLHVRAIISDGTNTGGLHKVGEGALLLTGANTYTGPTLVTDGTLRIANSLALGTSVGGTVVSNLDGARLLLESNILVAAESLTLNRSGTGSLAPLESRAGTNQWNGPISLVITSEIAVLEVPSPLFIGGAISGAGGLTKVGPGRLSFVSNTVNSYVGTTFVREGELILAKGPVPSVLGIRNTLIIGDGVGGPDADRVRMSVGDQIANDTRVILNSSGLLELTGVLDLVGSLEGDGHVAVINTPGGTGGLIVGRNDLSTTFAGVISGTGNFQKTGLGTLRLTGNHTFTGTSQVDEGVLQVDGSIASSLVMFITKDVGIPGRAGTLAGNGSVPKIFSFPGGTVSPGASPGRLTSSSNIVLRAGILRIELNGTAAGVTYDQLRVATGVELSNAVLQVSLGFIPPVNDSFRIIDNTGASAVQGTFAGLPPGGYLSVGSVVFRIAYDGGDGNDVVLTRISAPPSIITSIQLVTPEKMQILGEGLPGVPYVLEATLHLNLPIPWAPIATNTANNLGIYEFVEAYADQGLPLYPQRFFRVRSP